MTSSSNYSPTTSEAILSAERLIQLSNEPFAIVPTVKEAFEISKRFNIPLYPKYSFYWDSISIDEALLLKEKISKQYQNADIDSKEISCPFHLPIDDPTLKDIVERLGITHSVINENDIIEINSFDQVYSLIRLLVHEPLMKTDTHIVISSSIASMSYGTEIKDTNNFISKISGIDIKPKFASSIAVRVGRPEKAAERKMKPPVHALFPIGYKGGATRDILKAS